MSKLFGKTLRDAPAEAEFISHKLLIQSGMIHQVSAGVYSYLPLAWKSLKKIETIVREALDAIGAQEVKLGILQPREIWQKSGRDEIYGPDMIRLNDRRNKELVLPPTNEELITETVKVMVNSYKDLPVSLYQIQTKFRDEPRPRAGLIRVREFDMMDAYSFDVDEAGLDKSYDFMLNAYKSAFEKCGITTVVVDADSGAIGGKDSKEFVLLSESGEDTVVLCTACEYAANDEKATFNKTMTSRAEKTGTLQEIRTPNIKTIEELTSFLGIDSKQTIKVVLYMADKDLVLAVTRGDLDINEVKLKNALKVAELRVADQNEINKQGIVAGFVSPVGLTKFTTIVDDSITHGINYVGGANKIDYHLTNINYPRDFTADIELDISIAREGDPCPQCTSELITRRGIEIGHIFKLGTRYSDSLGATYTDNDGKPQSIVMGCYGIGIGRILAGSIEEHSDDKGIVFPKSIAPYEVLIVGLNTNNEQTSLKAAEIYTRLSKLGIDILYDDRNETAGVKFNDADLIGIPIRIVVSTRNIENNLYEIKKRCDKEGILVSGENIEKCINEMLLSLEITENV
tara:strand:+ start:1029 stop:2744 length:1716 start_codon:yes stop_codon:yes gene_type:complete